MVLTYPLEVFLGYGFEALKFYFISDMISVTVLTNNII